jgi:hypothetical protein
MVQIPFEKFMSIDLIKKLQALYGNQMLIIVVTESFMIYHGM